jgi:D-hydroxyproline dehydrogenase subunit beta
VTEITHDGVRLRSGSTISAGVIVNAAGSWSPSLTAGLKVKKRKGHLLITDRYPQFLRHQLVELGYLKSAHSLTAESVAFNIQPRKTGQLLIGSSRQFEVEDSAIDNSILTRMLARAIEFLPGLGRLSALRAWTGFRAATPDKLPLIGPAGENERLYLATGHEGLGITTSLATAKLLVDQIVNRTPAIKVAPYLPSRVTPELIHA